MSVRSIVQHGFSGLEVVIECRTSQGLPVMTIVGSASRMVDEARERIRSAFLSLPVSFPKKRVVINLAPADMKKPDTGLDLAIAIAILEVEAQIPPIPSDYVFFGELGLDGALRPVRGLLGALMASKARGARVAVVPAANSSQARLIEGLTVYACHTLCEVFDLFLTDERPPALTYQRLPTPYPSQSINPFADIAGQAAAKRALVIAAAGRHNMLLDGPPGTGKSMLAQAFHHLLPPMSQQEIIETTHLHSLQAQHYNQLITLRPLRAPHHSASDTAIIGGGAQLRPGEMSLAHNGVLFLDELPEFKRSAIEALRQPLENRSILLSRAAHAVRYPADFVLLATANPCPCGFYGSDKPCQCTPAKRAAYRQKLSGPILDRIDLHLAVMPVEHHSLLDKGSPSQPITIIRRHIQIAHDRQAQRLGVGRFNTGMSNYEIKQHANLTNEGRQLLEQGAERLGLSPRAYMRTIKVGRTIADLADEPTILPQHIAEALQYRIPS